MKRTPSILRIVVLAALLGHAGTYAQETAPAPAAKNDRPVMKERTEPLPEAFEGVGVDEHPDAQLPLDLEFTDHNGKKVKLGDYFDGEKPVILTLNYYRCPQLCTLQLNGMVDTLKEIDWKAGDQFRILTISFDPMEGYHLANVKRQNYLKQYGEMASPDGWSFLVGKQKSIKPLLETTGFNVRYNEDNNQWVHAAALILCTPDGRISRYLVNLVYEPKTLRLSLVEASEGKIGSPLDHIVLFCSHFDGEGYSLYFFRIMQIGATLIMLAVGIFLAVLWLRERRKAKTIPATT
jgi:protein SCO1/2